MNRVARLMRALEEQGFTAHPVRSNKYVDVLAPNGTGLGAVKVRASATGGGLCYKWRGLMVQSPSLLAKIILDRSKQVPVDLTNSTP
jgi:hypothetical protein